MCKNVFSRLAGSFTLVSGETTPIRRLIINFKQQPRGRNAKKKFNFTFDYLSHVLRLNFFSILFFPQFSEAENSTTMQRVDPDFSF